MFYRNGWRGINIDPALGSKDKFDKMRPEDINLELAISNTSSNQTLYLFENPQENTMCEQTAQKYQKYFNSKLISTHVVPVRTIAEILDQYNFDKKTIDFINIDVEGLELEVLKSNNWTKYKPKIVAIEQLEVAPLEELSNSSIYKFLKEHNYELFAKTPCTVFYYNKENYNIYSHLESIKLNA